MKDGQPIRYQTIDKHGREIVVMSKVEYDQMTAERDAALKRIETIMAKVEEGRADIGLARDNYDVLRVEVSQWLDIIRDAGQVKQ